MIIIKVADLAWAAITLIFRKQQFFLVFKNCKELLFSSIKYPNLTDSHYSSVYRVGKILPLLLTVCVGVCVGVWVCVCVVQSTYSI